MGKKKDYEKGYKFIEMLFDNPKKFYENGSSYNLLEEYFQGFPLKTLKPLLHSEDFWIKRIAIWICSELGYKAYIFFEDVLLLAHDKDFYVNDYALEIIANCADNENLKYFLWILDNFESKNKKLRILSMGHIESLLPMRIKEIYEYLKKINGYSIHEKGFLFLSNIDDLTENKINEMLCNENAICRKYGVIAAYKMYNKYPQIINNALNDNDSDIKEYAELVVKTERIYQMIDN